MTLLLLPSAPSDDAPPPAAERPPLRLISLRTGWCLGLAPGRAGARTPDAAPTAAGPVTPDGYEPPKKRLRCGGCAKLFSDRTAHFYHRCKTSRFPLVVLWDFQIEKPGARKAKSRRKCSPLPRARTKNLSKIKGTRARAADRELWDVDVAALRPKTRGDCKEGGKNEFRPCSWISCRFHMAFTFDPERPSIKENFPYLRIYDEPDGAGLLALEALVGTCALDIADEADHGMDGSVGLLAMYQVAISGKPIGQGGALTLEQTARRLNISVERARQIGARAMQDVRVGIRRMEGAAPGAGRRS